MPRPKNRPLPPPWRALAATAAVAGLLPVGPLPAGLVAQRAGGSQPAAQQAPGPGTPPRLEPVRSLQLQPDGAPRPAGSGHWVTARRQEDQAIRSLTWQPPKGPQVEVPLPEPVADCEPTISADGRLLLVLAGGIRGPLNLVAATVAGPITRIPTPAGRRLPATFADGLGSLPVTDGAHVVVFAYATDGAVEVLAVDPEGRQLGRRRLPGTNPGEPGHGFTAGLNPARWEVQVDFAGAVDALVFPHPLAPRVVLDPVRLRFGEVVVGRSTVRTLSIGNTGQRPLAVQGAVVAGATGVGPDPADVFQVLAGGEQLIQPGGTGYLEVRFVPARSGAATGELQLRTNSPGGQRTIALEGAGREPEPPPEPISAAGNNEGSAGTSPGGQDLEADQTPGAGAADPQPDTPRPAEPPSIPIVRQLWWQPRAGGGIALHGLLAAQDDPWPLDVVLVVVPAPLPGNGATRPHPGALVGGADRYPPPHTVPVEPGGAFAADLPEVTGGESLRISLQHRPADGEGGGAAPLRSPWQEVDRLGPWLASAPGVLELRGQPGEQLLLMRMAGPPGGALGALPTDTWRVRLDLHGRATLDAWALGQVGGNGPRRDGPPRDGWFTALDRSGLWAAARLIRW